MKNIIIISVLMIGVIVVGIIIYGAFAKSTTTTGGGTTTQVHGGIGSTIVSGLAAAFGL